MQQQRPTSSALAVSCPSNLDSLAVPGLLRSAHLPRTEALLESRLPRRTQPSPVELTQASLQLQAKCAIPSPALVSWAPELDDRIDLVHASRGC